MNCPPIRNCSIAQLLLATDQPIVKAVILGALRGSWGREPIFDLNFNLNWITVSFCYWNWQNFDGSKIGPNGSKMGTSSENSSPMRPIRVAYFIHHQAGGGWDYDVWINFTSESAAAVVMCNYTTSWQIPNTRSNWALKTRWSPTGNSIDGHGWMAWWILSQRPMVVSSARFEVVDYFQCKHSRIWTLWKKKILMK